MREILRIWHGKQSGENYDILRDYNLEVYEGQIVYIQGLSGSGITSLIRLLEGRRGLDGGMIWIDEQRLESYGENTMVDHGIYVVTERLDLVGNLTVAENLEVLRRGGRMAGFYNRRSAMQRVNQYLKKEGLSIRADRNVQDLLPEDCYKLSIVKARMQGARLIVLDCTNGYYEGRIAGELMGMIRRIRNEGVAFLILSERLSIFAYGADRIQMIRHGRDLMEWDHVEQGILEGKSTSQVDSQRRSFEGFYDYDWGMNESLWEYFRQVKEQNRYFWEEYVRLELLPEGCYHRNGTVFIPKDSAEMLFSNLGIRENVILTIPERIGGKLGYISEELMDNITSAFYRITGTDPKNREVEQLSCVERKILSVYRWEVAKPSVIILESPYWGMDLSDAECFYRYLMHLREKGIRVICFSKTRAELEKYCDKMIQTEHGRHAKFLTGGVGS